MEGQENMSVDYCWCVDEAPTRMCDCDRCDNGEPDGLEKQDVREGRKPCCPCHASTHVGYTDDF